MSTLNREHLPQSMRHDGVRIVCLVESKIDVKGMKLKRNHWYSKPGHQYTCADFDVRVVVGSADLKFQLCSKDGQNFSKDHDEIEVTWDPPTSGADIGENMDRMFPAENAQGY